MADQVIIEFIGDTSSIEEAYNKLNNQITQSGSLNKESASAFQKANADIASSFGHVTDAAQKFSEQLRNLNGIVAGGVLKGIVNDLKDISIAQDDVASGAKEIGKQINVLKAFAATGKTISAGFEVASGSLEFFGLKNEQLERSMRKVEAAMKVINGLIEIQGNLSRAAASATTTLQSKIEALTVVKKAEKAETEAENLATGGWVAAAIAGIGAIGYALYQLISTEKEHEKQQQAFTQNIQEQNTELEHQINMYQLLGKSIVNRQLAQKDLEKQSALREEGEILRKAKTTEGSKLRDPEDIKKWADQEDIIKRIENEKIEIVEKGELDIEQIKQQTQERVIKNTETGLNKELDLYKLQRAQKRKELEAQLSVSDDVASAKIEKLKDPVVALNVDVDAETARIKKENSDLRRDALRAIDAETQRGIDEINNRAIQQRNEANVAADPIDKRTTTTTTKDDEPPQKLPDAGADATGAHDAAAKKLKEEQDLEKQIQTTALNFAKQTSDQIFALENQNRNNRYNAEISTLQKQAAFELNNNNLTQAQKLAIQRKFQKEEAAVKLQQFKADQKAKEEQAAINGALSIVTLTASTPPMIGLAPNPAYFIGLASVIATTATSVATIAAQKPPQFAKGTPKGTPVTPAGTKLVGEHGPELIYTPGGERIITAPDTAAILAKYDVPALPNVSPAIAMRANLNHTHPLINEDTLAQKIAQAISKQTKPHLTFDKNGFTAHLINRGSKTTILNNKYKL